MRERTVQRCLVLIFLAAVKIILQDHLGLYISNLNK